MNTDRRRTHVTIEDATWADKVLVMRVLTYGYLTLTAILIIGASL